VSWLYGNNRVTHYMLCSTKLGNGVLFRSYNHSEISENQGYRLFTQIVTVPIFNIVLTVGPILRPVRSCVFGTLMSCKIQRIQTSVLNRWLFRHVYAYCTLNYAMLYLYIFICMTVHCVTGCDSHLVNKRCIIIF